MQAQDMVDLERYPIAQPDSAAAVAFTQACQDEYLSTGMCVLANFIQSEALATLAREANALIGDAFFCDGTHNAYLTENTDLDDDVRRMREHTFVGSVAYDRIASETALRTLYLWDPLKTFIGKVLEREPFYRFADPLGACSINVFTDGGAHGWHFDESEYTVTLMLQRATTGGDFEYVPQIRGTHGEHTIVSEVLKGNRKGVKTLPFTAGTLLIFGGRQTLHRVTQVSGDTPRLVPVLCYSEQPNCINSDTVRRMFWGRTGTETT